MLTLFNHFVPADRRQQAPSGPRYNTAGLIDQTHGAKMTKPRTTKITFDHSYLRSIREGGSL